MRTALPAGFETCPPLWACPDVEEGLKSTLGCLVLGQLLAATAALEYPPVHAHRHHKATQPSAFGLFGKAGVSQARPELIEQRYGALGGVWLWNNPAQPLLSLHHQVQGMAKQPAMSQ